VLSWTEARSFLRNDSWSALSFSKTKVAPYLTSNSPRSLFSSCERGYERDALMWLASAWPVNEQHTVAQRARTTFDLRAILQKLDNPRGNFQQNDVQNNRFTTLKIEKGEQASLVSVSLKLLRNSNEQVITDLYQCDFWLKLLWHDRSFNNTNMLVIVTSRRISSGVLSAIRFLFSDLTCFVVENVLSHTYVLPNIECIFSKDCFSLENLSLLTNFWKLYAVCSSLTPSILYIIMNRCYVCSY